MSHPFDAYFLKNESNPQVSKLKTLCAFVERFYPQLEPQIRWNQPMYVHQGAFIIGFSLASKHISVAVEQEAMHHYASLIDEAGYECTAHLFKIKATQPLDNHVFHTLIDYNLTLREGSQTFWQ